ncbi:uncharacterized protein LOC131631293 [Vicia villosa]|uniref:uncharacterized protein LOC131631293 n=1 Tax=Vicia villosa TaxID=3911 RepID=UPI00273A9934|nr:uncharacterized protein LOC131631293 [Vicia villosa]
MGSCASNLNANKSGNNSTIVVNIVHSNGKLQQLKEPIKAWHVLSQNPNHFLCSSETMYVGSYLLPVPPNQELQLDHIYFLLPLSKSNVPLSLQDLCSLAIKANTALNSMVKSYSVSQTRNFHTHPTLSNLSLGYSH